MNRNSHSSVKAVGHVEYGTVDWLKALAILAVVFVHSGLPLGQQAPLADHVLRGRWVAFHVPTFLFVSGFLYRRASPIGLEVVALRMRRILVPYLVASLVAFAIGFANSSGLKAITFDLLSGAAFGVYYYVFVICALLPLIWLFSRMPAAWVALFVVGPIVYFMALFFEPALRIETSWFWGIRNPIYLLHYFAAGWLCHAYLPQVADFGQQHQRALICVCATMILGYLFFGGAPEELAPGTSGRISYNLLVRTAYTFSVIALVALVIGKQAAPAPIRLLSDASFTVYLYHPFVMKTLMPEVYRLSPSARILVMVSLGLSAGVALALAGRLLLRQRSRILLGS
jgi:fucose 4-O-acetylase-like acetyltransferase